MNKDQIQESVDALMTLLTHISEAAAEKAVQQYAATVPSVPVCQPTGDRFLTVPEVCELLKTTPQTLWRWDRSGRLPKLHFGGQVRYRMSDVQLLAQPSRSQKMITDIGGPSSYSSEMTAHLYQLAYMDAQRMTQQQSHD